MNNMSMNEASILGKKAKQEFHYENMTLKIILKNQGDAENWEDKWYGLGNLKNFNSVGL